MHDTLVLLASLGALLVSTINSVRVAGIAHHQRHHCGTGYNLGTLLVTLQDTGIVLPDELREAADWHREHALVGGGDDADDDDDDWPGWPGGPLR
jgi:hypothetical protein